MKDSKKPTSKKQSSSNAVLEEIVISDVEIAEMSAVLVRRFGSEAMNMAAFFLDEHLEVDDHERAESWLRVMDCLDKTYHQSLKESVMH